MKKIRIDRLPSTRIFTMGRNQFCSRDLILCSYQLWYSCNKIREAQNGHLNIVCQFEWSVSVTLTSIFKLFVVYTSFLFKKLFELVKASSDG